MTREITYLFFRQVIFHGEAGQCAKIYSGVDDIIPDPGIKMHHFITGNPVSKHGIDNTRVEIVTSTNRAYRGYLVYRVASPEPIRND